MGYMPVIATNNCNPLVSPVTNIPNDISTGCIPSGWCGIADEWIRLNNSMQARYDTVQLVTSTQYNYTYPKPKEEIHHPIKITDCPKCNSNLPLRETDDKGICKCEFCGKEVYVW